MYEPAVTLSVSEYRSRLVGVIGAVAEPGFYPLTNDKDTLLDMIAVAGGTTTDAGSRIRLIPSTPTRRKGAAVQVASTAPASLPVSQKTGRDDAIPIDIRNLTEGGNQVYLNLPARPGDVIIVPERGEVMVEGWVNEAGAYPISPGMTLIGSVAAAKGTHFGGNQNSVRVVRSAENGHKLVYRANFTRIRDGKEPDISLRPGDVVHVNASPPKASAWFVYKTVMTMINIALISR